jgi:hypothetical protein
MTCCVALEYVYVGEDASEHTVVFREHVFSDCARDGGVAADDYDGDGLGGHGEVAESGKGYWGIGCVEPRLRRANMRSGRVSSNMYLYECLVD